PVDDAHGFGARIAYAEEAPLIVAAGERLRHSLEPFPSLAIAGMDRRRRQQQRQCERKLGPRHQRCESRSESWEKPAASSTTDSFSSSASPSASTPLSTLRRPNGEEYSLCATT